MENTQFRIKRKAVGKASEPKAAPTHSQNRECSIWRADIKSVALESLGTLVLRPGSAPEKSQEVIFEVVQEVGNTGKEDDYLALWFSPGKEEQWEMHHRIQKDGVKIKQDDEFVEREGK